MDHRVALLRFFVDYGWLLLSKSPNLVKALEKQAKTSIKPPFLCFENQTYTATQFNQHVNRRAHWLSEQGIKAGDTVGIMLNNGPAFLEMVMAVAKCGAISALYNTYLTAVPLAHCLSSTAPQLVISEPDFVDTLIKSSCAAPIWLEQAIPNNAAVIAAEAASDNISLNHHTPLQSILASYPCHKPPHTAIKPSDTALLIFTSGTTGLPKAARITHQRWYTAGVVGGYAMQLTRQDGIHCALPLYHSSGIMLGFASAVLYQTRFILERRFSTSSFWETLINKRATCLLYIGELFRYLVNQPTNLLETQHHVRTAFGNGLRADLWQTIQTRFSIANIREFYSATEGNIFTLNTDNTPGSMGKPIGGKWFDNTAVIRYDTSNNEPFLSADGRCEPCAPNEAGELLGLDKRTNPFCGYTDPTASEKKRLRNVFKKGDCYFRSGDWVKKNALGHYYFLDRMGDTFRWKGENVSTQEIETLLMQHPDVAMACMYGVSLPTYEGQAGMAAVQLCEGTVFDGKSFFAHVQQILPEFAIPRFIRLVSTVDTTQTMKLAKTLLQQTGYDLNVVQDPVFYLNLQQQAYAALAASDYEAIQGGAVTF